MVLLYLVLGLVVFSGVLLFSGGDVGGWSRSEGAGRSGSTWERREGNLQSGCNV